MSTSTTHSVKALNDAFRTGIASSLGQWLITSGVNALGSDFVALAVTQIMAFDDFTPDNDPYGEHDFGSLNISGETVFWKFDYYDLSLRYGSDDPSNPAITKRILTVMLASEY